MMGLLENCLQCSSTIINAGSKASGKHSANALVCCNKAAAKALQVASPHCLQLVWGNKVQISSQPGGAGQINLTENKGKVFCEAFRVLKDGGRLEVNDIIFGEAIPPAVHTSLSGWAEYISGALPEGEYVDLVQQAGFKDVRVRRSTRAGSSNGVPIYSIQVSAKKNIQAG
jgi:hypothetical protein